MSKLNMYDLSSSQNTMGPASTSKALLNLEKKATLSSSSLDSTLLDFWYARRIYCLKHQNPNTSSAKFVTSVVAKSQFLGKVKDFLPVMAEANARLQHDAKEKSCTDYNIEELTANESKFIEMDLVLGVADLHTPEAVAAAEFAMGGSQAVTHVVADICGSDSESGDDNSVDANTHFKACSSDKLSKVKYDMDVGLTNGQGKKRKKIVELL